MNDGFSSDTSSPTPSPEPAPAPVSDNNYSGGGYGGGSSKKDDDTPSVTASTTATKSDDNFFGGNTDDVAPASALAYRRAAPTPTPAPTNDDWGRDQPRTNQGVGREDVPDAPVEPDADFGARDVTIGGSDDPQTQPGVLHTEFPTWGESDEDIAARRRLRDAARYDNRSSSQQPIRAPHQATDGRYTGRLNGSAYGTPPVDHYLKAGLHLRDRMARADAQPSRVTQGYEELPANKDREPFWTPTKKAVAAVAAAAVVTAGGCMALDHFQDKTDTVPVPENTR